MRDKSQPPDIELGLYRHYKSGNVYRVAGVELHKSNRAPEDEWLVRYSNEPLVHLGGTALWYARKYEEFIEDVPDPKHSNQSMPRFKKIEDD